MVRHDVPYRLEIRMVARLVKGAIGVLGAATGRRRRAANLERGPDTLQVSVSQRLYTQPNLCEDGLALSGVLRQPGRHAQLPGLTEDGVAAPCAYVEPVRCYELLPLDRCEPESGNCDGGWDQVPLAWPGGEHLKVGQQGMPGMAEQIASMRITVDRARW